MGITVQWQEEVEHRWTEHRKVKDGIIGKIKTGSVKTLIVYDISRVCYGAKEFVELWELCHKHGCRWIVCKDGIDTNSPTSELVGMVLAWISKAELAKLKERTKDKMAYLKKFIPLGGKKMKSKDTNTSTTIPLKKLLQFVLYKKKVSTTKK